jgi:hypothetical protein
MKIIEGGVRVAASDVANFLACQQLTQLDLQRARGMLRPPRARDLGFEDLVRRGEEHERTVLERFRRTGTRWRTSPGRRTRPGQPRLPSAIGRA